MNLLHRIVLFVGLFAALCCGAFLSGAAQPRQTPSASLPNVDYYRDIQPILAANCVFCHSGPGAPADLHLDSAAGLIKGGTSRPTVVPGNAEKSLLMIRVEDTGNNKMPPTGNLQPAEIALLKAWINQGATAELAVDFSRQVEPIFRTSCYSCHSGNEPRANLHLDNKTLALRGGDSGADIIPGNAKGSLLLHRVRGEDGKPRMPRVGAALTTDQIAVLEKWIDQGANWPELTTRLHWSYVKPVRPAVPAVKDAAWVRNPIDNFILARLENEGLLPSPVAPKETLVRRLYLDLIGLPPSPAQIDDFLNDNRSDAYERLVDQLLASPHFGERMATPWLDLARYGDSNGYERDYQRVAWPYRDWVIKAFNENKPFDQFTIEQLAGDLLPNATIPQRVATGFVRSSMLNTEGGTDADEQLWVAEVDRAITVGNVFLGSTIQCSQCHNHKYDPFTQKQFYQMVAFFSNAKQELGDGGGPFDFRTIPELRLLLPTEEQANRCKQIDVQLSDLNARLNANTAEFQQLEAAWEASVIAAEKAWQPVRPERVTSKGGSTLTVAADNSVLASGKNPESDEYVIDIRPNVMGGITGLRIDALPDASLPSKGPGRDDFGNFVVNGISLEAGNSTDNLSKVPMKLLTDLGGRGRGTVTDWRVTLSQEAKRVPLMLLVTPDKPITADGNIVLRIRLSQSEEKGAGVGHFRLSVTTQPNPEKSTEVIYLIRPMLNMAKPDRLTYRFDEGPVAMAEAGSRPTELSKSQCGQPSSLAGAAPRDPNKKQDPVMDQWRTVAPELATVRNNIASLRREVVDMKIASTLVLSDNPGVDHPKTFMHERGMWTVKTDEVGADAPGFLGPLPEGVSANRLGLAKWLISPDNPLTPRVRVNQIWQTIFGMGIVETSEDFGTQGFPPSHPELLDWLATEFISNGWDQKAIIRLIVTSNMYRQSSNATKELIERDPRNVLHARGARYRVEAEMVRDIALTASGLLSTKIGGPPVMPFQPPDLWKFPVAAPNDNWVESKGEDRFRRGLYVFIRRTVRFPSLLIFDAPSREMTTARRNRSNTPFQALTLLNDPAFVEAAQALSQRIQKEGGTDTASRLAYGFRLVTSRKPNENESKLLMKNFNDQRDYFSSRLDEAKDLSGQADADLAAWTIVSNSLLSLNETITRE